MKEFTSTYSIGGKFSLCESGALYYHAEAGRMRLGDTTFYYEGSDLGITHDENVLKKLPEGEITLLHRYEAVIDYNKNIDN